MDARTDSHPTDRFEVKVSRVRGELRTAEARPVFLTFDFDNKFWTTETDVYSTDVNPVWKFPTDSDPSKTASETGFFYKTEVAHRFHKKYLTVTLSERSTHGDVAWGSGTVSIDSVVLGCENIAVNMLARDDATCYGTVRFSCSMVNVAEVRAQLSEVKLTGCAQRFVHDVELVYFELGMKGFEKGYRHCTERCSDAEPQFRAKPILKRDCNLREMVSPSPGGDGPLRIFFSVQRQVARNRTEQIGIGALPVRMLFRKVGNGFMEAPTKFKVPLQNKQGMLKGKVLLENIPRFYQLLGNDLVNLNGVITPIDEDLELRKIVPWVKLPRPLVTLSLQAASVSKSFDNHQRVDVLDRSNILSSDSITVHADKTRPNSAIPQDVDMYMPETADSELSGSGHGLAINSSVSNDEWIAVEDPTSGMYYFANKETKESLWLPPEWKRSIDSYGRSIYINCSSGAEQHTFPATSARRYRETVATETQ